MASTRPKPIPLRNLVMKTEMMMYLLVMAMMEMMTIKVKLRKVKKREEGE